jgi:D-glycero-alpha-D-manno-heptose-7-phosphate kinase
MITKADLAKSAIHIEQDVLKENVGCQDQIWAAYGGCNRIDFLPDGTFTVAPLMLKRERCEEFLSSIMLVFTGFSRFASEIAGEQIKNLGRRQQQLRTMQDLVGSEIYAAGRAAGAIGGKLLGAGGGGFMVFFVEPEDRERVREGLKDLIHVSVGLDRDGSKIVLFQPEGL